MKSSATGNNQESTKERACFLSAGYAGGQIRSYRYLVVTLAERAINGETDDKSLISYGNDLASNAFYFAEATKARVLLEKIADLARKYEESEISVELQKKKKTYLISSLLYR